MTTDELTETLLNTQYGLTPDVTRWLSLVRKYFPPEVVPVALQIMQGESGGDPNKGSWYNQFGGEDSHGLYQINLQAHPQMRSTVLNPEENVKYASQLYNQQGWVPWANTAKKYGISLTAPQYPQAQTQAANIPAPVTRPTTLPNLGNVGIGQATKSYVVRPGDTLSAIAQRFLGNASNYNSLTGYRSGNPNLIYPGEVIRYG